MNVLHCRAGNQCIFNYNLFSLPLILSNISGSRAYISDFPYPVGRDTKVSLPSRKDRIASSCFNFNDAIPISWRLSLIAVCLSIFYNSTRVFIATCLCTQLRLKAGSQYDARLAYVS